ncbi:MAG: flagellar hook-length control protein FliK [Planctomycetota bacterium]|jgi:flagellar hook-length control protein FliK
MNVSVSTLGDILGQTAGQLSASSRPDVSVRRAPSPVTPNEGQAPADAAPHAASGHDSAEIRREPAKKGGEDFNEVIRQKTKSPDNPETPNRSKPTEHDAESNAVDQPASPSQHSTAVQPTKDATTGKAELPGQRQPQQLLAETKAGRPHAGEAATSAELNLLATATRTQSGLTSAIHAQPEKKGSGGSIPTSNSTVPVAKTTESQTVEAASPAELNLLATATKSQSGLTVGTKTQPEMKDSGGSVPAPNSTVPVAKAVQSQVVEAVPSAELNLLAAATKKNQSELNVAIHTQPEKKDNTGSIPTQSSTAPVAKAVTEATGIREQMPGSPIQSAATATNPSEKSVIVETPAAAKTPTSASPAKALISESVVDGSHKTTHAADKTPVAAALPAMAQAKPAQPQAQVVTTGQQRSVPTPEIEAELATAQTPSKSPNPNGRNPAHNSSEASSVSGGRQVDVTAVQAATGQTQAGENSNSNGGLSSGSEQMLLQTTPPTQIDQPSTTFAAAAKTTSAPEQNPPSEPYPSVSDQVLDSVRSSLSQQTPNKQITIQLHPPELGKVSVKIEEQDAQITGVLEVSKAQTRSEIEQALPQIIRNLAGSGVQIGRFEVVLSQSGESQQQTLRDHSLHDSAFGQHNSSNSESSANQQQETATHYGPTGRGSYQSAVALQEMVVRDDSIDILV